MAKNTEWTAAAYLSHSRYGINTKILTNNYYNDMRMTVITCCGASAVDSYLSEICEITYGETTSYPQSTTRNITGVFDMLGGAWEIVMGVFANSEGTLWSGNTTTYNSGFNGLVGSSGTSYTSGIAFPEEKYYNVYKASNGTVIDLLTACNSGYCYGHGLSEVSGWYDSHANFISSVSPWFLRGSGSSGNMFNFGSVYGGSYVAPMYGFRSILVIPQ